MEAFSAKEEMQRSARTFFVLILVLVGIGLVMVYSASGVKSARAGYGDMHLLLHQSVKAALGLFAMLTVMRINYLWFARHHMMILFIVLGTLILVLIPIPGLTGAVNGAWRWFRIGPFMIQPSEFAKLGLIIVLASLIVRIGDRIENFLHGFCPLLLAVAPICFLTLVEPDFGTCVLMAALAAVMLVIGGTRIYHFIIVFTCGMVLMVLFALSNFDHILRRIMEFICPPETGHVSLGLTALGSGGMFGEGLGGGLSKLYFLPLCESDFIFAVIGEELGFVGASAILLVFVMLVYHGMKVLMGIKNRFGFLVALGILLLISTQAIMNIAVVLRVAPAKGIALPFISSGGSSMLALMIGVGIFLRIAQEPDLAPPKFKDDPVTLFFRKRFVTTKHFTRGDDYVRS